MNKDRKPINVPEKLILTANITAGLNIVVSLIYLVLSILAIVFRFNCSAGAPENVSGSEYFWNVAYRVYFQDGGCDHSLPMVQLTSSYTVFIMMILTLGAAVIGLIAAICLIMVMQSEDLNQHMNLAVYSFVGICFGSLIIDLTLAAHFGIDHSLLSQQLGASSGGLGFNYERDIIRLGAITLMTFTLKGYVFHAINILLLILLVMFLIEYQKLLSKPEHSIHKIGVLNAYDNHRRRDDWHHSDTNPPFLRGPHINNAFLEDEPHRMPLREPTRPDYYSDNNRPYDRSDSWQRSQTHPNQGARPFSYLEDNRRPVPVKPQSSPAVDPNWRRDPWPPAPPVPVPDYSPQTPRRLKSALKPGYM
ncbi:hypothetical protein K1T71_000281 [Dendrolimus kikuchii]|uniref:Uncharacterized protein n=1 Tax=Dendrolimus kikuchii TaxID=765133 RepID=A0ACC1DIQ4_9NEOP|nr:hypothetical protein K1T71_000281 [Dendrolimus kikuchii]